MTININVFTRASLTSHGRKVLIDHHDAINADFRARGLDVRSLPRLEAGDVFRGSLWELMHIFGPSMANGAPISFVNNQIDIEDVDEGVA
jgi:hypothetical protein